MICQHCDTADVVAYSVGHSKSGLVVFICNSGTSLFCSFAIQAYCVDSLRVSCGGWCMFQGSSEGSSESLAGLLGCSPVH